MRPENLTASLSKLYVELGVPEKIEEILTAFYLKMSKDVMLGFFFTGKDLHQIVNQQKAFLLRAMGVSDSYHGKVPARAHTKIAPILKGHFDRRMLLLRQTLTEFGISAEGIATWISFEEGFRRALVKEEGSASR